MMPATVTLLYSSEEDPVYVAFRKISDTSSINFVHLDEVVSHLMPRIWPKVFEAKFPASMIEKFSGATVINRVFSFDSTLADTLISQTGYHESWIHAAINSLLSGARKLCHDTGYRGVSRSLLALNNQWLRIGQVMPGIDVPRFAYCFGGEHGDLSGMIDPFQKSVWSVFDWKEEHRLTPSEKNWNRFFVDRPAGTPVVGYYLESSAVGLVFPREVCDVDMRHLEDIANACRLAFRSDIGEFLTYVRPDGRVQFAAFSPMLKTACTSQSWQDNVQHWLAAQGQEVAAA